MIQELKGHKNTRDQEAPGAWTDRKSPLLHGQGDLIALAYWEWESDVQTTSVMRRDPYRMGF